MTWMLTGDPCACLTVVPDTHELRGAGLIPHLPRRRVLGLDLPAVLVLKLDNSRGTGSATATPTRKP